MGIVPEKNDRDAWLANCSLIINNVSTFNETL